MRNWRLEARGPGWEVRDDEGALVGRLSEIARRDALLMTAGPALLVACEEAVRHLRAIEAYNDQVAVPVAFAMQRLKTAIAATKGA